MKAIGYVRVSTEEQASKGVSIEAQRVKLEAYADLYDLDLVDVIVDAGYSAKSLDRPGLHRALNSLESGEAEALLIFKLDRLTRSVRDLDCLLSEYFADKFSLLSVSEQVDTRTAAGRLVLNVLMSVAQWEREAIGERTATALSHKKANGEHVGSPAFGYQIIGKRLKKSTEHKTVQAILAMRENGMTLTAIADHLNAKQIPTARGGKWYAKTVANIIDRENQMGA
ncbi:recombinase family protein [Synechocystis salina LEGE 06099]|uniref:recombinase family protein n=1 Tax=Synechocystis salina TaxID=945780 RepID=UPI001881EA8C|nr:recombinase family protein [Synechocystis salina]MBE9204909.1 recombinase family protein [Synechocystis salina LEGE 06099]